MKSTYKRNGTLNLFAALEIASGHVHAQTTEQKKLNNLTSKTNPSGTEYEPIGPLGRRNSQTTRQETQ